MTEGFYARLPSARGVEIADVRMREIRQLPLPSHFLEGLWRKRQLVVAVFASAVAVASAVAFLSKPIYRAEARVLIENLETSFNRSQDESSMSSQVFDESELGSQMQVIASGDLGRRVIDALGLAKRADYAGRGKGGWWERLRLALGFGNDPSAQSRSQRILEKYRDSLSVYAVPRSRVIAIRYSASDAETASAVANTLADIYVMSTREAQNENTLRASEWLSDEIEALRVKLAAAETAVEEFRSAHGLIEGTSNTLSSQELTELTSQVTVAEAARATLEAKEKAIRDMLRQSGNVDATTPIVDSPLMQRLREQQIDLRRRKEELSATYLSSHPRMISNERDLAKLDEEIRAEAQTIIVAIDGEAEAASIRVARLRDQLAVAKSQANEAKQNEVKLRALEREAAANKTILETYLSRLTDASARRSLAAQPGVARIIERAETPAGPVFPKKGPVLLLGATGGVLLGLGLALTASVMTTGAGQASPRRGDDGGENVAPPFALQAGEKRVAVFDQIHPLSEIDPIRTIGAARSLAASVLTNPAGRFALGMRSLTGWALNLRQSEATRRFLVCGGAGGLELPSVTLAFCRGLVHRGMRVILIDSGGASKVAPLLAGHDSGEIAEAIVKDPASALRVLDCDRLPGRPTKANVDGMIQTLERSYDLVVVKLAKIDPSTAPLWRECQAAMVIACGVDDDQASAVLKSGGMRAVQFVRTRESHKEIA